MDITQGIPPQHVLQGALVLCNTLPYMPEGVHLAVVDPGVGGHRRALAPPPGEGPPPLGPHNRILLPPAHRRGGGGGAPDPADPRHAPRAASPTLLRRHPC